jgi:periplasmic divalent cation tolerance protein
MSVSIEALNAELQSDAPDVGLLIAALDEADISVRAWAAQVIGKVFGYSESPPPDQDRRAAVDAVLVRCEREETAEVRSALAQTLALLGVPEEERPKLGTQELRFKAADQPVDDCLLMETTVIDEDDAVRLARGILDARLAASVQITGGVRSMSWFEGDFGDAEEWRLAIVTTATRLPELEQFISENHPYGQPIIMVSPILGNRDFISWVNREVGRD